MNEAVKTQQQLQLELKKAQEENKQLQNQLQNVQTAIQTDIYAPEQTVRGRRVRMDEQGVPQGWSTWYETRKNERNNALTDPKKFAPEFLQKFEGVDYQPTQTKITEIPEGIVDKRIKLLNDRPHGRQIPTEILIPAPIGYHAYSGESHIGGLGDKLPKGCGITRTDTKESHEEVRNTPFFNIGRTPDYVKDDLYNRFVSGTSFNDDEQKYLAEIDKTLTKFVSSQEWKYIKEDFYNVKTNFPEHKPDNKELTFTEPYLLQLQYWLLKFTSLSSRDQNYQNMSKLYFGYGRKPYAALSSILDVLHSLSYKNITYHCQIDQRIDILNKSLNYLRTSLGTSDNFEKINEFFELVDLAGKLLKFLSYY